MDPSRPPELDAFVLLLRSATPPPAVLADARAGLLESAGGAGSIGLGARIAWLMLVALAITAAPRAPSPAPASKPAPAAPRAEHVAPLEVTRAGPVEVTGAAPVEVTAVAPRSPVPVAAPVARVREPAPRVARTTTAAPAAPIALVAVTPSEPGKQGVVNGAEPRDGLEALARPEVSVAPSAALAEALRDYAHERYAEAAIGFQRVVAGMTDDPPVEVEKAEFFLAKCLYHLGLHHASAAAFDEVTRRGEAHPYFDASLTWLAMLASDLPEPSGVIASVGRYDAARLRTLDREGTRDHYHHLLYLLGRARYGERRLEEAVALLRQVPGGSRWALEARFFEGVSHVRARRARPALASFRAVIEAVRAGRTGGHEDPNRLYDLAWMSVARLYYSLAMQSDDDARASALLSLAIASWRRIPLSSEHWLDSFYEETWALYVARHYARALGHVHALTSPHFRDRADPEALVVRAMIFFEHCQWDAAEHAVRRFHARFDRVHEGARRAARMAETDSNALRVLFAVRAGRSRVPESVVPALRAALSDREVTRHVDEVRSIRREQRRLGSIGAPILDSALHDRVAQELAVLRSLAEQRAAELTRERIDRMVAELSERMTQMDTIELELATVRRHELERPNPRPMGPVSGGPIYAIQGDQIWPWNGEWWRDELPFYVQDIANRCGR